MPGRRSFNSNFSPHYLIRTRPGPALFAANSRCAQVAASPLLATHPMSQRAESATATTWAESLRCHPQESPLFHAMRRHGHALARGERRSSLASLADLALTSISLEAHVLPAAAQPAAMARLHPGTPLSLDRRTRLEMLP